MILEHVFTEEEADTGEVNNAPGPTSRPGGAGVGTQAPRTLHAASKLSTQGPFLRTPLLILFGCTPFRHREWGLFLDPQGYVAIWEVDAKTTLDV